MTKYLIIYNFHSFYEYPIENQFSLICKEHKLSSLITFNMKKPKTLSTSHLKD